MCSNKENLKLLYDVAMYIYIESNKTEFEKDISGGDLKQLNVQVDAKKEELKRQMGDQLEQLKAKKEELKRQKIKNKEQLKALNQEVKRTKAIIADLDNRASLAKEKNTIKTYCEYNKVFENKKFPQFKDEGNINDFKSDVDKRLSEKNLKLVEYLEKELWPIINKAISNKSDRENYLVIAKEQFMLAFKNYDPGHSSAASFKTYFIASVTKALKTAIKESLLVTPPKSVTALENKINDRLNVIRVTREPTYNEVCKAIEDVFNEAESVPQKLTRQCVIARVGGERYQFNQSDQKERSEEGEGQYRESNVEDILEYTISDNNEENLEQTRKNEYQVEASVYLYPADDAIDYGILFMPLRSQDSVNQLLFSALKKLTEDQKATSELENLSKSRQEFLKNLKLQPVE